MSVAAVFLDRDGTLVEEGGYLDRIDRVVLYPWTIDAIRVLNRAGLRVVLLTNQAGVARGYFPEAVVAEIHAYLDARITEGGARIDAYYYCPHHPDGTVAEYAKRCNCRKPARGLVDRAVEDLGVDPATSFVVGDRWHDIRLARVVGARGLLVRTGFGASEERRAPADLAADAVVDNLAQASSWILQHL
ncbi:MAG: D-glycero-alpha-D-manno-heptose-1,7-bisphosphate 7-phosphatase [Betaproteobacteria bacterium]